MQQLKLQLRGGEQKLCSSGVNEGPVLFYRARVELEYENN